MTPHWTAEAERYRAGHWLALILLAAAYTGFVVAQWSEAYVDFGDGNYMYIATRIAQGALPYRDVMAPQPPCHLYLGAGIVTAARLLKLPTALWLFRGVSVFIHLASFALVAGIARRAWGRAAAGVVAGALFLFMPIGLWWSMGWQSEPLEILFLLLMMRLALNGTGGSDFLASICGALAALTNATAAPFLLALILFMLIANWRRAFRLAIPAALIGAAATYGMEFYTQGHFLKDVVLNQTGTYPRNEFVRYAVGKLVREGADIVWLDGFFIALGVAGFFLFLKESPLEAEARGGLAWFSLATFLSFLYVTKGGTVDYIFCLGEPAAAVMGAGLAIYLAEKATARSGDVMLKLAGALVALVFALGPPASHYVRLWNGLAFELPDLDAKFKVNNVQQVKSWIDRHSKPGDAILAPPFYAFLTGRRIWGDYCEIFIWRIKDLNDRMDKNPKGEGWTKTKALAAALERKEIPLALVEMDQTGQLPEVKAALEKFYKPVIPEPYQTLNTRLGVYVPKDK